MIVRLTEQAFADVEEAVAWYEAKREGLAQSLVNGLWKRANPLGYAVDVAGTRKCNLQQFPFAMWYRIEPDQSIVIACLHSKRSPRLARERAAEISDIPET